MQTIQLTQIFWSKKLQRCLGYLHNRTGYAMLNCRECIADLYRSIQSLDMDGLLCAHPFHHYNSQIIHV